MLPVEGETLVDETNDIGYKITKQTKLKKEVDIYVRERFWLEAQRIIDRNGRAYRPPPVPVPPPMPAAGADTGEESDEVEEVEVQQKEKPPIEQVVISDNDDDLVLPAPEEKPDVCAKRVRPSEGGNGREATEAVQVRLGR